MLMTRQSPHLVKAGPQNQLNNMKTPKLSRDAAECLMQELSEVITYSMWEENSRISSYRTAIWDDVADVMRDAVLMLTIDVNNYRITIKFPSIPTSLYNKPITHLCTAEDIMRKMDQVILTLYRRKWLVWHTELVQEHLPMHFCDDEGHTIKVDLTQDAKQEIASIITKFLKEQREEVKQHELQQSSEQNKRVWKIIAELKNSTL